MPYIDMANIACGFHAGNRETMKATIALAKQHQVLIGAHPSYPDRENFGRLSMALSQADICDLVFQQVSLMEVLCEEQQVPLSYIKPHDALYLKSSTARTNTGTFSLKFATVSFRRWQI